MCFEKKQNRRVSGMRSFCTVATCHAVPSRPTAKIILLPPPSKPIPTIDEFEKRRLVPKSLAEHEHKAFQVPKVTKARDVYKKKAAIAPAPAMRPAAWMLLPAPVAATGA